VGSGPRCVIWNYDIFGLNGGRSKEISDLIAEVGPHIKFLTIFAIQVVMTN
jgi:hypothetical protein